MSKTLQQNMVYFTIHVTNNCHYYDERHDHMELKMFTITLCRSKNKTTIICI